MDSLCLIEIHRKCAIAVGVVEGNSPNPPTTSERGFAPKDVGNSTIGRVASFARRQSSSPTKGPGDGCASVQSAGLPLTACRTFTGPLKNQATHHSQDATDSPENAHSTGLESHLDNDRPWLKRPWRHVAAPRLSPESFAAATSFNKFTWASFERTERQNRDLIREACSNPDAIFQRETPPVNLLGGYKFPAAPQLDPDLVKTIRIEEGIDPAPSSNIDHLLADDGHPSGIPAFLRRVAT